jgi:acyl carrier protein
MTKQEFIDLFVEELEIEDTEVSFDTELNALDEWDSMGHMIIIGLVSDNFNLKLTSDDLKKLSSINDIIDKIGADKFEA